MSDSPEPLLTLTHPDGKIERRWGLAPARLFSTSDDGERLIFRLMGMDKEGEEFFYEAYAKASHMEQYLEPEADTE